MHALNFISCHRLQCILMDFVRFVKIVSFFIPSSSFECGEKLKLAIVGLPDHDYFIYLFFYLAW